ncbi:CobD/CbiB family cobalamin biosynthesis protein [Halorubrum trueperi]|uniref:Probable cobalamin biosynthesis protein CobD n=1 Tax=Halorubrum trueperi TaxID=2004704 RepID=A0ABD5UIF1_9EURY
MTVTLLVYSPAFAPFAALAVAIALDLALAEPPSRVHPVAMFGSVVEPFDRPWTRPRLVGVAVAIFLPAGAAALAGGVVAVAVIAAAVLAAAVVDVAVLAGAQPGNTSPFGALVAGALLFSVVSLRLLLDVTAVVVGLTEADPATARESVRTLVGRDTTALSPGDLRSAAVESAAENLADGFVAPLGGFAVGSTLGLAFPLAVDSAAAPAIDPAFAPAIGVAGAVWVKAVNTLDSMLGYRSKPVGWASARLDDAVMYLPARATAVCLAVAVGSIEILRRAASWAGESASPNSGWPMATVAAALDVRLEKPGHYVLNPDASPPSVTDAERAVRLVGVAGGVAVAGTAGWLLAVGTLLSAGWPLPPAEVVGWP